MIPEQREVAGLYCFEVLEKLSDYLDGELEPGERQRLEAHVSGCDWCARFGGEMAGLVQALRIRLGEPEPLDAEMLERIGI
ncbi:MAG: zf-HC2 domain-containing protein [Bryobacterales bacterium]|nr:zf-HC2 domain-containing protein [Bryobacterales bacterium]